MVFKERQKFNQLWIWITIILTSIPVFVLFFVATYKQIIQGVQFGNNPMSNTGLIIATISTLSLVILLLLLFGFAKLTTTIDKQAIRFKFFPFQRKSMHIDWNEVNEYQVIKYNPIGDFGGWGIRKRGNRKVYNVAGNIGLLLILKSGKEMLLGTKKGDELAKFLSAIHAKI